MSVEYDRGGGRRAGAAAGLAGRELAVRAPLRERRGGADRRCVLWPSGYADAIRIYDDRNAGGIRARRDGAVLWRFAGGLAELVNALGAARARRSARGHQFVAAVTLTFLAFIHHENTDYQEENHRAEDGIARQRSGTRGFQRMKVPDDIVGYA